MRFIIKRCQRPGLPKMNSIQHNQNKMSMVSSVREISPFYNRSTIKIPALSFANLTLAIPSFPLDVTHHLVLFFFIFTAVRPEMTPSISCFYRAAAMSSYCSEPIQVLDDFSD